MKQLILALLMLNNLYLIGQSKKLNIIVDERMELITTIQYLSDYFLITTANINYKKDIDNYFKKYKDHKAIQLLDEIQNEFFNFDKVPLIMYHYSFPEFELTHKFTPIEESRIKYSTNKNKIQSFFDALRDFYQVTNFNKFYNQHKTLYEQLVLDVKNGIGKHDVIGIMESYYGINQKSYTLVLTPLLHDGGFATKTQDIDGTNLYAIIGPSQKSENTPIFDSKKLLQDYVIHEFSHTFCNPLIDKVYEELEADNCLFNPIKEAMKKQAYSKWKSCLYEHLVRANEVVLTRIILGDKSANEVYENDYKKRSFIYLKGIVPLLNTYQTNHTKYDNLEEFMPQIVNYFHNETEKCK